MYSFPVLLLVLWCTVCYTGIPGLSWSAHSLVGNPSPGPQDFILCFNLVALNVGIPSPTDGFIRSPSFSHVLPMKLAMLRRKCPCKVSLRSHESGDRSIHYRYSHKPHWVGFIHSFGDHAMSHSCLSHEFPPWISWFNHFFPMASHQESYEITKKFLWPPRDAARRRAAWWDDRLFHLGCHGRWPGFAEVSKRK